MDGLERLSDREKMAVMQTMNEMQMQEAMNTYSKIRINRRNSEWFVFQVSVTSFYVEIALL